MSLTARLMKRVWRLRREPVVARRLGRLFLLDPHNWIDNRLLAGAPYEDAQLANARRAVEAEGIDLVVDIGANFGLYSCVLGGMESVRTVYAFEPSRRNHAQLMANLYLNGLTGKVRTFAAALGAEPGEADLHIDPRSTGTSRLDPATSHRAAETWRERESVRIERFDDLVADTGRRAFVKIDVEGAAVAVVTGMSRFLAENRAVVQVEISPAEREVEALLAAWGYGRIGVIGEDVLFAREAPP